MKGDYFLGVKGGKMIKALDRAKEKAPNGKSSVKILHDLVGDLKKSVKTDSKNTLPKAEPDGFTGSAELKASAYTQYLFGKSSANVKLLEWQFGKDFELKIPRPEFQHQFGAEGVGVGISVSGGGKLGYKFTFDH